MKHSRRAYTAVAIFCLFAMIFDSKTAISGATEGIRLCISTVIPSLFPFFLVSGVLISVMGFGNTSLFSFLGVPKGADKLLLVGFLGGYPVGAQSVSQQVQTGNLSRQDAERLLAFCSNAGPAFLFGIGATIFGQAWICWLLWSIHVIAALAVACLLPRGHTESLAVCEKPVSTSLTAVMVQSVRSIALVCGWIVAFRTVITFATRWFLWLLPSNLQLLLVGLMELTNGCCDLQDISSLGLRMQLFSVFLGFGGLCVLLQTHSVIAGSGLTGRLYFPGKVAQATISYLLCLGVQMFLPEQMQYFPGVAQPLVAALLLAGCIFYFYKTAKNRSFSQRIGV